MLVKKTGLGLQNLVTSANEKILSSQRTSTELIRGVTRECEFPTADHLQRVKKEMSEGKKAWDDVNDAKLEGIIKDPPTLDRRLFLSAKQTGSWLTVRGTTVIGTIMPAMEFCDFLSARYNVTPPNPKENAMVALSPFPYVTDFAADTKGLSLHIIMRCRMSSFTSHDKPSPLTVYAANP